MLKFCVCVCVCVKVFPLQKQQDHIFNRPMSILLGFEFWFICLQTVTPDKLLTFFVLWFSLYKLCIMVVSISKNELIYVK